MGRQRRADRHKRHSLEAHGCVASPQPQRHSFSQPSGSVRTTSTGRLVSSQPTVTAYKCKGVAALPWMAIISRRSGFPSSYGAPSHLTALVRHHPGRLPFAPHWPTERVSGGFPAIVGQCRLGLDMAGECALEAAVRDQRYLERYNEFDSLPLQPLFQSQIAFYWESSRSRQNSSACQQTITRVESSLCAASLGNPQLSFRAKWRFGGTASPVDSLPQQVARPGTSAGLRGHSAVHLLFGGWCVNTPVPESSANLAAAVTPIAADLLGLISGHPRPCLLTTPRSLK